MSLILFVLVQQILILINDQKDKDFIINNLKRSDFEFVELKHQKDYDNKIEGCDEKSPIIVLKMKDDINTKFLACKADESWCETCTSKAVDNYDYAHLKQFFDDYKKTTNTTLEIKENLKISDYIEDTLYIDYNDENKNELIDFAKKLIKTNARISSTPKYKAKIKYTCDKNNTCNYEIKSTGELSKILDIDNKQV